MMLLKKSLILLFLLTMSIILSIDIINSSSNILVESANAQSALDSLVAGREDEEEVLHIYNPQQPIDEKHGEPYHAVLPGNRSVAISHLRDLVDVPIEINGTGISSGSFEFEGSALVFHKTSGEPFTVTYTVNAVAREINK